MRIYLADLGHNQVTISSDVYPLGVGNLATYLTAHLRAAQPIEVSIVREPQDLKAALDARPADVLGVSSYSWNHNLARAFARYAKARRPETLVLMGGPNFPLTAAEQESFLRGMNEIDVRGARPDLRERARVSQHRATVRRIRRDAGRPVRRACTRQLVDRSPKR